MKEFEFEGVMYKEVLISSVPDEFQGIVTLTNFEKGACTRYSYDVASKKIETLMVEGYLLSIYSDRIECVGHAWNKRNDQYFDVTKDMVKQPENFLSNHYYVVEEYSNSMANILRDRDPNDHNIFSFENNGPKKIHFKTNAKKSELNVRKYLTDLIFPSGKEDDHNQPKIG